MSKQAYTIDLDLEGAEAGGAIDILTQSVEMRTYEDFYRLRKPLGIYNISVSRLDTRLERAARALHDFMETHAAITRAPASRRDPLSDYLESCIYAAAEHIDDVESCLKCFFKNANEFSKSKAIRRFKKALRKVRRNVSAFANAIKHQQARVRLYEFEFSHDSKPMVLLGFFIEGVEQGEVGPSKIVHGENVRVVSIVSFLWEVFTFTHEASDLLATALNEITGLSAGASDRPRWPILRKALIEIARLPNFSLDGAHPFERANLRLQGEARDTLFRSDDLYGSLGNRWSQSQTHAFGGSSLLYEADGVTRTFALADPQQVRLQHWRESVDEVQG